MPCIYSVEIMIAATVYVVAKDEADAVQQVQAFHMDGGEMRTGDEFIEGLPVSGARFGGPDFPTISISPAVTVHAENLKAFFVEEAVEPAEDCEIENPFHPESPEGRAWAEGRTYG